MSRVILSRYSTGQERIVVGWDHPAGGYFWQIFNQVPKDGSYPDDWEEVIDHGGMWPGLTAQQLLEQTPDEVKQLLTARVQEVLTEHRLNPDSGRIILDMSEVS